MKLYGVDLPFVDYQQALAWQEQLVLDRYIGVREDTLLLLQHPPVFTLGRGGKIQHLLTPHSIPVYRISRGGDVTFHGPGQLIGYPIIDLTHHGRDIHSYLRGIETVLIAALAKFGIVGYREKGRTGVWVGGRKIASIGVGIRRWVTYHGFALNIATDLARFQDIIPCGLMGVQMTSMTQVLDDDVSLAAVKQVVAEAFVRHFGYEELLWQKEFPPVLEATPADKQLNLRE